MPSLDDLDWKRLTHAYGSAADVPALIRDLSSAEAQKRNAALEELFTNIWHQGTVYEATAEALPFLIALLQQSDFKQREGVVLLVACILAGRGYCEVHHAESNLNPFTRKPVDFDVAQRIADEQVIGAKIRRRGAAAIPLLLPFLSHEDAGFRGDIARALAQYPSHSGTIEPALLAALGREQDHLARRIIEAAYRAIKTSCE